MLLAMGADPNAPNMFGSTPLHLAALAGTKEVVELLLAAGAETYVRGRHGTIPLHLAADRPGKVAIVAVLVSKGAQINAKDDRGFTPLDWAESCNRREAVELLRKNGGKSGKPLLNALMEAARSGDVANAKAAIKQGADVNWEDRLYVTPLERAAQHGHKYIVELLIASGADVNKEQYWMGPLNLAVSHGQTEVVAVLVRNGANVDTKGFSDWTPLHVAACKGYKEIVELLLAGGADIAAADDKGQTPLDVAKDEEVKKLLREHGGKAGKELKESGRK